jgi:chemotaxis protein MotB
MARHRKHEEHQNHEAWAIPYGDLITLLLAFFVVMYAMSSVNEGKYRILSDSLTAAFRGSPMTLEPVQTGQKQVGSGADISMTIIRQQELVGQPRDLLSALPVRAREAVPGRAEGSNPPFTSMPSGPEDEGTAKQLEAVANSVEEAMSELIDAGMIVVRRKQGAVEVEIRTDILFPSGQSTLTASARGVIERVGDALRPFPNSLHVEGHTDDRPISTAQFPSNWELSAGRAASVVHLLTQRGLDPARLTVIGYGEQQPVGDNATVEGRNHNRRVLIVVRGVQPGAADTTLARLTVAPNAP